MNFDGRNFYCFGSLIGEAVPHSGEQLTEPVLVYHSAIIIIKAAKCVLDHVLWVGAL